MFTGIYWPGIVYHIVCYQILRNMEGFSNAICLLFLLKPNLFRDDKLITYNIQLILITYNIQLIFLKIAIVKIWAIMIEKANRFKTKLIKIFNCLFLNITYCYLQTLKQVTLSLRKILRFYEYINIIRYWELTCSRY